jgi:hypothetical protein
MASSVAAFFTGALVPFIIPCFMFFRLFFTFAFGRF